MYFVKTIFEVVGKLTFCHRLFLVLHQSFYNSGFVKGIFIFCKNNFSFVTPILDLVRAFGILLKIFLFCMNYLRFFSNFLYSLKISWMLLEFCVLWQVFWILEKLVFYSLRVTFDFFRVFMYFVRAISIFKNYFGFS